MMQLLMNPKFLPTLQMAISLAAAAMYAVNGDYRRTLYWLSSIVLVGSMTY